MRSDGEARRGPATRIEFVVATWMLLFAGLVLAGCPTAPDCGGAGQPCCSNGCRSGTACIAGGDGGTCQPCGSVDGPCCDQGAACAAGLACAHGACAQCGTMGAPCCETGGCGGQLVCAGGPPLSSSRCLACGGLGQVCCADSSCGSRLQCHFNVCLSCGTANAPCCANGAPCDANTQCVDGFCDPVDPVSMLFHRCTADIACGTGLTCDRAYPAGLCTRSCTRDSECGPSGVCTDRFECRPRCTSGGRECANFGSACAEGTCLPSCSATIASGEPSCVDSTCDPFTGRCSGPSAEGRIDGEPCVSDAECRSAHCFAELDALGMPTGALGGMCTSFARAVPVVMGGAVPTSNCPTGAGAPGVDSAPGDFTACFPLCDDDSQCRLGYRCDRFEDPSSGVPYFTNGVCMPIDCARWGANACPGGTMCVMSGTTGVCARSSADGGVFPNDAEVDASVDAAAEE